MKAENPLQFRKIDPFLIILVYDIDKEDGLTVILTCPAFQEVTRRIAKERIFIR